MKEQLTKLPLRLRGQREEWNTQALDLKGQVERWCHQNLNSMAKRQCWPLRGRPEPSSRGQGRRENNHPTVSSLLTLLLFGWIQPKSEGRGPRVILVLEGIIKHRWRVEKSLKEEVENNHHTKCDCLTPADEESEAPGVLARHSRLQGHDAFCLADWASLILQGVFAFPWDKALIKQVVCPFIHYLIAMVDILKVPKILFSNVECDTALSVGMWLWTNWDPDELASVKTSLPTAVAAGSTKLCLFLPLSYNKARVLFFHTRK